MKTSLAVTSFLFGLLLTGCSSSSPNISDQPTIPVTPPVAVSHNEWAWVSGSNSPTGTGVQGSYGTLGMAGATNTPGSRAGARGWTDRGGNLWIFGGYGQDATATALSTLNDLWKFNPSTNQWTWAGGSKTAGAQSVFGTQGASAPTNVPGGRSEPAAWSDGDGNFWMYGGNGVNSNAAFVTLSDLWFYAPASNSWTWVGGSKIGNTAGIFGTLDVSAPENTPSARSDASTWTDKNGNLWLFGGYGFVSSTGNSFPTGTGPLNDLWKYSPTTGQWAWMGGSTQASSTGSYGRQGTADAANMPPARSASAFWTDASGNFWLFGGTAFAPQGAILHFNDLWQFSPQTLKWTWVSGSNQANAPSVYGTLGTAAASNVPGARWGSTSWSDSSGKLWLFGGSTDTTNTESGNLNDLWSFNTNDMQWTWAGGSSQADQTGVYGVLGTSNPSNAPGGRNLATGLTDHSGNLWLFGGVSRDPNSLGGTGFNDLWKYQP